MRARAVAEGFEFFSALIEAHPPDRTGLVPECDDSKSIDNYLRSGMQFVYVQADLAEAAAREASDSAAELSHA